MSRPSSVLAVLVPLIVATAAAGCNDDRSSPSAGDTGTDTVDVADDGSGATDAGEDAEQDERISLDVGPSACPEEDDLAPNQTLEQAYRIETGSLRADALYVCEGVDDWFVIPARAGRAIRAQISFAHRVGDLDLYLLGPGGADLNAALAESATEEDVEQLRYVPTTDGDYVLVVDGFEDAGGGYALQVQVQCTADSDCSDGQRCSLIDGSCVADVAPECGLDASEPNNRLDEAEPIELSGGEARLGNRFVCEEDDDYYRLDLAEPSTVRIELSHDVGEDLTLTVFDANGRIEARGPNTPESSVEVIQAPFLSAGVHYIAVDDAVIGLGLDVGYDLTISVTPGSCSSNNDCGTVPGRQLCEDGGCVGFVPDSANGPGGACDDDTDCESGLFCYAGAAGFSDNLCTQNCEDDARCGDYEGGYCLFLGGRSAVCMDACTVDADCPGVFSCDRDAGECVLDGCGTDADCAEGQVCRRSEAQDAGFCTANRPLGCTEDDAFEPNDTTAEAVPVPDGGIREATICNADEDWYRVTVAEDGTELTVTVSFEEGVDIDVFVYDTSGRTVGDGSEPTREPEIAEARYLAAGEYLVRVNQFPGDFDRLTTYSMTLRTAADRCSTDGGECLSLVPLRIDCVEESGACAFLEGDGEVAPGGACDSNDDCAEPAEFCWNFEPATEGRNICTRQCATNSDCDEFTGTACTPIGRRFSACLPN